MFGLYQPASLFRNGLCSAGPKEHRCEILKCQKALSAGQGQRMLEFHIESTLWYTVHFLLPSCRRKTEMQ